MWPLELVATATDSPRYSPGGSFNKFGADVNGISGTFSMVALRCANAGAAISARTTDQVRIRVITSLLEASTEIPILWESSRAGGWRETLLAWLESGTLDDLDLCSGWSGHVGEVDRWTVGERQRA